MSSVNYAKNMIKSIDFFGKTPHFYYAKSRTIKSMFGGCATLCLALIAFYILLNTIMNWINYKNSSILSSINTYSDIELMVQNKTLFYNLSSENYYPYIVVQAALPNGTFLNLSDLKSYFTLKVTHRNEKLQLIDLETEPCYYKKQDQFLQLSEDIIKSDGDYQSAWSLCLKDPLKMGFVSNSYEINVTSLNFQLFLCKENCANESEIKNMLKYASFSFYSPKTTYDFTNIDKPGKIIYETQTFFMDFINTKYVKSSLIPSIFYYDIGWISDEYVLGQTSFNIDRETVDVYYREENEAILSYYISIGSKMQSIQRRNQKFYEVIGNYGGLMGIIFKLFSMICSFYNCRKYEEKIIKSSFQTPYNDKIRKKFSFFSAFWPFCFKKREISKKDIKKNLYECLDISIIIKKIQEIEKIKKIFFNYEQKILFNKIPQPTFSLNKSLSLNQNLSYEREINEKSINLDIISFINSRIARLTDKNESKIPDKNEFSCKQIELESLEIARESKLKKQI